VSNLRRRDFEAFLRLLPSLYAIQNLDSFPQHIVRLLPRLIAADSVAFNTVNVARNRIAVHMRPAPIEYGVDAFDSVARAAMHDHPLIAYQERTHETRVLKLSDFVTRRQLWRLRSYNEALRPIRIEYLIAAPHILAGTNDHIALALGRERTDFGERERELLDLLQPHFLQAYRNAQAVSRQRLDLEQAVEASKEFSDAAIVALRGNAAVYLSRRAQQLLLRYFPAWEKSGSGLPQPLEQWLLPLIDGGRLPLGLCAPWQTGGPDGRLEVRWMTAGPSAEMSLLLIEEKPHYEPRLLRQRLGLSHREAEVLFWIARGKTSAESATILSVSRRTIDKHLEHIYTKLGIESRVDAAALVWKTLRGLPPTAADS